MTSHTLCMTSHSVCVTSHEHFMISHPYRYDITSSVFMTSYPIYMISPILLSWKHNEYTWHLIDYIWHHSHCICVVTPSLSIPSKQLWKSSHLAHVWHHTLHHIHTLWHQYLVFMTPQTLHSWHQISSIWHHIHSLGHHTTLCMTSSPLDLTSRPLNLCHHTHPIDDIKATIWMVSHPVYLWHHISCI